MSYENIRIQCNWYKILGLDEIYGDSVNVTVLQLNKNISHKLDCLLEKCLVFCDRLNDELVVIILDDKNMENMNVNNLLSDMVMVNYKDFICSDSSCNFLKNYDEKVTEYILQFCKKYVSEFIRREIRLFKKSHILKTLSI